MKTQARSRKELFTASALIAAVAALILAFCAASPGSVSAAEDRAPTVFVNDEPWSGESKYPFYQIYGRDYVAVSLFTEFDKMFIAKNTAISNLMLARGSWYMTFDYANDIVYTYSHGKNSSYELNTGLYHGGELYVPVEDVTAFFNLNYERSTSLTETTGSTIAIRISESGAASENFIDLLRKYNPAMVKNQETTVTRPPETDATEVTFSVAVAADDSELTRRLLDAFEKSGAGAAFFLSPGLLADDPTIACDILAAGLEIGVYTSSMPEDGGAAASDALAAANAANDIIFRYCKKKTRLVLIDPEFSTAEAENALLDAGYAVISADHSVGIRAAVTQAGESEDASVTAVVGADKRAVDDAISFLRYGYDKTKHHTTIISDLS